LLRFALHFALWHLAVGVGTFILGFLFLGLGMGGNKVFERLWVAVMHLQFALYAPALGVAYLLKPPEGTPIPFWALALGYLTSGLLYGALVWLVWRSGAWALNLLNGT
jgi:hypothetical protein